MNVFFRELQCYRKGLFFWGLGIIALVASGMAKYAAYHTAGQSMTDLMAQLPQAIQIIFGLSGFDLSKASGFYGVLFIYIALMASVHAVLLSTDIISKEERDKTSEFLFVKPISRTNIITSKLLAGFVNLIVLNVITLLSSLYFVNYFGKDTSLNKDVEIMMTGLFFLQLLFFFTGTAIAAMSKKPKRSASIATSVLLFTFILSFLTNINRSLGDLKYLTPFKYFDAHTLLATGRLDPIYVLISLSVIAVMIFMTYRTYNDRDLSI